MASSIKSRVLAFLSFSIAIHMALSDVATPAHSSKYSQAIGRLLQYGTDLVHVIRALETRISTLERNQNQTISRCRICFSETEGSSQCQGNRASCSGWSDAGADWTLAFRDDTDNRDGGCTYQWKVECQ